jgi:hypothetical protein
VLVALTPRSDAVRTADLVFEWPTATGARLQALFQSDTPDRPTGPLAAIDAADLPIARAYAAALTHVGSLPRSVDASGIVDEGDSSQSDAYSAITGGRAVDVEGIQSRDTTRYAPAPVFTWSDTLPMDAQASKIRSATIPYSVDHTVTWTWNGRVGAYERSIRGVRSPNPPVRAVNIVVIWAPGGVGDQPARYVGLSGRASLFRGGEKLVARWQGASDAPLRVLGEDGNDLPLAPGNTWVEVVPNAVDITLR